MLEKYRGKIKIAFKHFPIPSHRLAMKASQAAMAAGRQGKFWEYHDRIFDNFDKLTEEMFTQFAKELGLDLKRFNVDRIDPVIEGLIQRDLNEARTAGVRGTPTIFINGKLLRQRNARGFAFMIEAELRKKK